MSYSKTNAVFPGSFDLFHDGHYQILKKAMPLFDKVFIVITKNIHKTHHYSISERIKTIKTKCQALKKIKVVINNSQLTVDLCKQLEAKYLIRGLRNKSDFQYEQELFHTNRFLNSDIHTIFFMADQKQQPISSQHLKEINHFKNWS